MLLYLISLSCCYQCTKSCELGQLLAAGSGVKSFVFQIVANMLQVKPQWDGIFLKERYFSKQHIPTFNFYKNLRLDNDPLHLFKLWVLENNNCCQSWANSQQSENIWPFWVRIIVILWICSAMKTVIFFSSWDKSHDSSANSSKFEQMQWANVS